MSAATNRYIRTVVNPKSGHNPWRLALEFAAHVVIAAIAFALIALVAFGLKIFIDWAEGWARPDGWMLDTLRLVEHGIFVIDVLTFVVYVLVTTWNFIAELCRLRRRST